MGETTAITPTVSLGYARLLPRDADPRPVHAPFDVPGLGYGEPVAFAMKPGFGVVGGGVRRTDIIGRPGTSFAGAGDPAA
jgi:hypothetical protein